MIVYRNQDIDTQCIKIVGNAINTHSFYLHHIVVLQLLGCRIGEVFNNHIRINYSNSSVVISPQKKNNKRVIFLQDDWGLKSLERVLAVQNNTSYNVRGLQREIVRLQMGGVLFCGKKKVGAHLFRHNFIRKMHEKGLSIEEMDLAMGYTTQSVANTYLISMIYSYS